jgi:hypothetical protein
MFVGAETDSPKEIVIADAGAIFAARQESTNEIFRLRGMNLDTVSFLFL